MTRRALFRYVGVLLDGISVAAVGGTVALIVRKIRHNKRHLPSYRSAPLPFTVANVSNFIVQAQAADELAFRSIADRDEFERLVQRYMPPHLCGEIIRVRNPFTGVMHE